eukprot:COSAG06_NODE_1407_length_9550_cov_1.910380_2_plen_107_part_00
MRKRLFCTILYLKNRIYKPRQARDKHTHIDRGKLEKRHVFLPGIRCNAIAPGAILNNLPAPDRRGDVDGDPAAEDAWTNAGGKNPEGEWGVETSSFLRHFVLKIAK